MTERDRPELSPEMQAAFDDAFARYADVLVPSGPPPEEPTQPPPAELDDPDRQDGGSARNAPRTPRHPFGEMGEALAIPKDLDEGMKPGDFTASADAIGSTVINNELRHGRSVSFYTEFGVVKVGPDTFDSDDQPIKGTLLIETPPEEPKPLHMPRGDVLIFKDRRQKRVS